jgi:hypothetical protein
MALKKEFIGSIEHVHAYNTATRDTYDAKTASEKINCVMHINVELQVKDNTTQFYVVTFKYAYNGIIFENKKFAYLHPMYENDEFMENDYNGNHIPVNELTTILIKYLLIPIDKLNEYSGIRRCYDYHRTLLETFSVHSLFNCNQLKLWRN